MHICSSCYHNIEEVNTIFEAMKDNVPEDRHYVFLDYTQKKRDICLECYIKTTVMFQGLAKK